MPHPTPGHCSALTTLTTAECDPPAPSSSIQDIPVCPVWGQQSHNILVFEGHFSNLCPGSKKIPVPAIYFPSQSSWKQEILTTEQLGRG